MPNNKFREAFLHYVWQYQYFDKHNLQITTGESIQILSPGFINKNSGPDFYNSRLYINDIEWHGTIEVHYKTSDWQKHQHTNDKAYNNVILHLVWEEDEQISREDGTPIPTLQLKNRVDKGLIDQFQKLIENKDSFPCANSIHKIDELFIHSMFERTLVERIESKSTIILDLLSKNKNNWEETCYQWLGKCFGFKINSDPFLQLCKNIPYSILKKYHTKPLQMEALLFGVAGFLNKSGKELYFEALKKEFEFLKEKHRIDSTLDVSEWKFLRLRPANFPTLRIAQFAAVLNKTDNLYDFVFNQTGFNSLKSVLSCPPNAFWNSHFHFEKVAKNTQEPEMGIQSIENIIINAIVPLRFAHAVFHDKMEDPESMLEIFRHLKPEQNSITKLFTENQIKAPSAYETQALVELYNNYCQNKECLSCSIGHQIISLK